MSSVRAPSQTASDSLSDDLAVMKLVEELRVSRTWMIATKLQKPTPAIRRVLQRLEARGLVHRHERYSAVNDIAWVPAQRDQIPATALGDKGT